MPPQVLSITDVCAVYNLTPRALRLYEDQGLLKPSRRSGWKRTYSASDCVRLELILKGKRLGFSLSEIGKLIGFADQKASIPSDFTSALTKDKIQAQIAALEGRRAEVQEAIEHLTAEFVRRAD